jgi:IclR family KDG regulon transcriptional repressor
MAKPQPEAPSAVDTVRAVDRACAVLCAFSLDQPRLTLGELSERVDLPKPTAFRIAASLVAAGFMTQIDDGRYGLGTRLMELGAIVRENLDLVQACTAAVDALAAATGETILVGQPDWSTNEIVVVARRDSPHALSILSPVGRRSPIPLGSLGKALLGALPDDERDARLDQLHVAKPARRRLLTELAEARERGYATDRDGFIDGVSGAAVSVLQDGRRPLGAIGVVGPSTRVTKQLDRFGELLLRNTATL